MINFSAFWIFPFIMGMSFFWIAILILAFVFWIKMLIDSLTRKRLEDRLVWVFVLIFLNLLGALLYYFLVYNKKRKK
jgi:prolipoprotein diacylglyceryltransferase